MTDCRLETQTEKSESSATQRKIQLKIYYTEFAAVLMKLLYTVSVYTQHKRIQILTQENKA